MITAILFASTLAAAPIQTPMTYAEAMRCESVLIVGTVMMDEIAKASSDAEAARMVPILATMAQRATADREAAGTREGVDPATSEAALMAEIEANKDPATDEYGARFEVCARAYGQGLMTDS